MTDKQKSLIESMNELCREKCDLEAGVEEANDYIDRNIEEFKLAREIAHYELVDAIDRLKKNNEVVAAIMENICGDGYNAYGRAFKIMKAIWGEEVLNKTIDWSEE